VTEPVPQTAPAWTFPSVGRWGVSALPNGWMFIPQMGVRQIVTDARQIAANVSLGEDNLKDTGALAEYIGAQAKLIEGHFKGAKIAGPQPTPFAGCDEAMLFMVRHTPDGAPGMLHVQTYVRVGVWLGIITLTTVEAELRNVRPDYEFFVKGLRLLSEAPQA
jgi:hypothetical protein